VQAGGHGGLKSYCLGSEDTCDEFWTPFENMAAALVGYDLPRGNPFATDSIEDPGKDSILVLLAKESLKCPGRNWENAQTAQRWSEKVS